MGIKQTDIMSFLEPESSGFLYDTARSFLKRHSNPESLLSQVKNLLIQGQLDTCRDMIQLIIREGHELGDKSTIYLMRAQVAYELGDNIAEVMSWVQQAKLCDGSAKDTKQWDQLMAAKNSLREGDYVNGQMILETLLENESVSPIAEFELASHLFWKNLDIERAVSLLEQITQDRPSFVLAWSCLGYAYNKLGMKLKAQEAFGHCLEIDNDPERIKIYRQQLAS